MTGFPAASQESNQNNHVKISNEDSSELNRIDWFRDFTPPGTSATE
jgi:hypothetical protein